jgi:glycosyltransferase involved in cell wall biosynthesis
LRKVPDFKTGRELLPKVREKEAVFVRSNPLDRDIRVPKLIAAANRAGYKTRHIYWDRERRNESQVKIDNHEAIPLRIKAPWGLQILLLMPVWWGFVFFRLMTMRFDIVHAINIDSIIPCLIAAKLKGKPVVYEILDFYVWLMPRWLSGIGLAIDKLFMRLATCVVVVDEEQPNGIGGIPNKRIVTVYDSPPDDLAGKFRSKREPEKKESFTLFYAGQLYRDRLLNLDKVIEAIRDIDGVRLIVAGYGDMEDDFRGMSSRSPDKLEFIGKISYGEVIRRGMEADLFFVLRDPILPFYRHICGSTLFNAMICGKPLLVNQGTSTTKKVIREKCGLAVDSGDAAAIKQAIIKLRDDPELYRELCKNARKAYDERYGWEIMARRLASLFNELTQEEKRAG